MKQSFAISIMAAFAFLPANLPASTPSALLEQISANNTGLQAERLRLKGEVLAAKAENNLPDPEVEFEVMASPASSLEMTVSETIEWPGVYAARRKAAAQRITAWDYLYESKRLEVLQEARLAYVDLINVNRRLERQSQILKVVNTILGQMSDEAAGKEYTILDKTKLKIEAFDLSSSISDLTIRKRAAVENLSILNGGKPVEGVDFDCVEYGSSLQSLAHYQDSYLNSPGSKAEYQNVLEGKQLLSAAKRSNLPGLTLGYKFVKEDYKAHGVVFGISLPIFSNRNKVKSASANYSAATFAWQNRQAEMLGRIKINYDELTAMGRTIDEYRQIVDGKAVTAYLEEALEKKAITAIDYLSEYKYLLEARSRLDEMEYAFNLKYAELSKYELTF